MVRSESGWARNDRDVERRVINFLSRQHFPRLRSVEVESSQGVVTIRGRVKSYHERQMCINCCQRVAGVVQLNDEIQVEGWDRQTAATCESPIPVLAFTGA
jgi:osmotically-inducible protein OsmY